MLSIWGKVKDYALIALGAAVSLLTAISLYYRGKVASQEKKAEKASKELLEDVNDSIAESEERGRERLEKARKEKGRGHFE